MSQKIDPKEVLTYLNELGYTNINALQLKEFITDLRKLIKYEYKHRKENIEQFPIPSYSGYNGNHENQSYNESHCPKDQLNTSDQRNDNVFDYLYNQPTVSSRAKEISKREKQISVHITKARNRNRIQHDHCVHVEKIDKILPENEIQFITNVGSTNSGSQLVVETESTIKTIRPSSKQSSNCKSGSTRGEKSKSAFMRKNYSKPINKCDPVALYHHYQKEWQKQKFPGQESHSDLRWAVREKLLQGPKVDIPRTASGCRSRCNSWKI